MNNVLIAVLGETKEEVTQKDCDVIYLCDSPINRKFLVADSDKKISSAFKYAKENNYEFVYFMSNKSKLFDNTIFNTLEYVGYNGCGAFSDYYFNDNLRIQYKRIEYLTSLLTEINVGHNALFKIKDFNPPDVVLNLNDLVKYGHKIFNHIPIPTYIME